MICNGRNSSDEGAAKNYTPFGESAPLGYKSHLTSVAPPPLKCGKVLRGGLDLQVLYREGLDLQALC